MAAKAKSTKSKTKPKAKAKTKTKPKPKAKPAKKLAKKPAKKAAPKAAPKSAKPKAKKKAAPAKKATAPKVSLRPLGTSDLGSLTEIDRRIGGRARKGFFEKRLKAATKSPDAFLTVAATAGKDVLGFAFARIQEGEFGGTKPVAVLDAMGVDPRRQGHGVGGKLLSAIEDAMRKRGIKELRSQAGWNDASMIRFFAATGFALAPNVVLERPATSELDF